MGLRRGFIYQVRPPQWRFEKPPVVLEHEKMLKEQGGLRRDLTDEEALMFWIGYQMGKIDGEDGY